MREDIQQDMGLYGNIVVESPDASYYSPVNSEEVLMLDDILMDGDSLIPYGKEGPDFAPMGRFGTVLLVNGEAHYHKMAQAGEVIRFILTNVANTRTFNLYFGVPVKLVGGDDSRFEKEQMVNNVVIAPAQRYVVEVRTAGHLVEGGGPRRDPRLRQGVPDPPCERGRNSGCRQVPGGIRPPA